MGAISEEILSHLNFTNFLKVSTAIVSPTHAVGFHVLARFHTFTLCAPCSTKSITIMCNKAPVISDIIICAERYSVMKLLLLLLLLFVICSNINKSTRPFLRLNDPICPTHLRQLNRTPSRTYIHS